MHIFLSRQLGTRSLPSNPRYYATSRFPKKVTGVGRSRSTRDSRRSSTDPRNEANEHAMIEIEPSGSSLLNSTQTQSRASNPPDDVEFGLKRLLLESDTLIIERQIEMLNIFIGYEQANKYTISNASGEAVGYIAENQRGFLGTISRQVFATHRPFKAVIMDQQGRPALWGRLNIPETSLFGFANFSFIFTEHTESHPDTFGEVQQIWHPWRRRYDLFLRERFSDNIASPTTGPNASDESKYYQIGKVDSEFLAWKFHVFNQHGEIISTVDRAFRGFGREIFTDTGKYSVHFRPSSLSYDSHIPESMEHAPKSTFPVVAKELDVDTRALLLALAVNIDVDYFSRHSHSGMGLFHFSNWD